jgi:hypothetical protein
MLICMKPTSKQLTAVKQLLEHKRSLSMLTNSEISRISGVHQSQVGRICSGQFRTFSFNVVQICKILNVSLPNLSTSDLDKDPSWDKLQSRMRILWDETPESAKAIAQIIDAVVKLSPEPKG